MAQQQGKLFEFAILRHHRPSKNQSDDGQRVETTVLVEPKRVIATEEREVVLMAARDIPAEMESHLDEVEVIIRPF